MLTAAPLLSESVGAARRQAWVFGPLFVARVLAGLLGLTPMVVLGARFLRSGLGSGATDVTDAFWLGLLDNVARPGPWVAASLGGVLAAAGGWLLMIVVEAGALRLLGAQAGHRESVPDEAFAEGVLRTPATWLVAGAVAALVRMIAFISGFAALGIGLNAFSEHPGVRSSLLMAIATLLVILLPFLAASLEVGFARAVILEEAPAVALGEGLLLAWERASSLFAPWYALLVADLAITLGSGLGGLLLSALPGAHGFWLLRLGPQSVLWLAAAALMAAVSMGRLGLYATLVTEAAGTLPIPPPRPRVPRPAGSTTVPPMTAMPEAPAPEPSAPAREPGHDGTDQG